MKIMIVHFTTSQMYSLYFTHFTPETPSIGSDFYDMRQGSINYGSYFFDGWQTELHIRKSIFR